MMAPTILLDWLYFHLVQYLGDIAPKFYPSCNFIDIFIALHVFGNILFFSTSGGLQRKIKPSERICLNRESTRKKSHIFFAGSPHIYQVIWFLILTYEKRVLSSILVNIVENLKIIEL